MAIIVCEVCGAQINVPESKLASTTRCPDCQMPLNISASGGALPTTPLRAWAWPIALAVILALLAVVYVLFR